MIGGSLAAWANTAIMRTMDVFYPFRPSCWRVAISRRDGGA